MTKNLQEQLDEPFELSPEQIEFYSTNGFIRLRQIFSPEVLNHYRHHVQAAVASAGKDPLDEQLAKDMQDDTYSRAFRQVINCWVDHPNVRELAFSKRLGRIAGQLMRVDGVRIYHDQALFKAPSGGHTPWHADQFYWPLSSDKTVTAWIPLVDVPPSMGPMEFASRSHVVDLGRAVGIGVESDRVVGTAVKEGGYHVEKGGFSLGDVSFHSGWCFHRAEANTSEKTREVFTVIYMDRDMRMVDPVNANQRADAQRYLEGVNVGEVCCGPKNPLIWEKVER